MVLEEKGGLKMEGYSPNFMAKVYSLAAIKGDMTTAPLFTCVGLMVTGFLVVATLKLCFTARAFSINALVSG